MSRIHEALKKAAQEKAQRDDSPIPSELVDLTAAPASRMFEESGPVAPFPAETPGQVLKYQELIQHCAHPSWHFDSQLSAFHTAAENLIGAEQFRTLRGRLYQISEAQPLKRILVTSSIPAEGKTFVATNLAQSIIMQPDRRVLLIDADLRRPQLHTTLGAPQGPGLTDYLLGTADEIAIVQQGEGVEGLCLIPSGTDVSNPSELLMNGRLKQLLDSMAPMFDWVILDSPPTLAVHDASILAAQTDGVLFVVRQGVTNFDLALRATDEFRDKNLLGVVFNSASADGSYGYYEYNYGTRGPKHHKH